MSDNNLYSFYETDSGRLIEFEVAGYRSNPPHWSDTIKITSKCHLMSLRATTIYGGQEDCIDFNNQVGGIGVKAEYIPQGKYVFTVKGGATGIELSGRIIGSGSEVDVDLGNWSDQCQWRTTGVVLDLSKPDGSPVTVRVLHADKPTEVAFSGPYKYVFPRPDAWYHKLAVALLYGWFRLTKGRIFK